MPLSSQEVRRIGTDLGRQIELLDRWGFTLITFGDYRHFLKGDLHLPRKPLVLTFDDCIRNVHQSVLPVLQVGGTRAIVFAVTGTTPPSAGHSLHTPPGVLPFDGEHLLALQEAGCEIGSLTCTNRPLTLLAPEASQNELLRSKEILEGLLGASVFSLAYPADMVSPEVKRLAAETGFEFAVCGATGNSVFGDDLFEIPRHTIRPTTGTVGLALRAFAPVNRFERLRQRSVSRLGRDVERMSPETMQ